MLLVVHVYVFPLSVKLSTGFLIRVGTEAEDKDKGQDIPHQKQKALNVYLGGE